MKSFCDEFRNLADLETLREALRLLSVVNTGSMLSLCRKTGERSGRSPTLHEDAAKMEGRPPCRPSEA